MSKETLTATVVVEYESGCDSATIYDLLEAIAKIEPYERPTRIAHVTIAGTNDNGESYSNNVDHMIEISGFNKDLTKEIVIEESKPIKIIRKVIDKITEREEY